MLEPHRDQYHLKSEFPNELVPAMATSQPVSAAGSKPWLKSRLTKATKVFSSLKLPKSAASSTSTLQEVHSQSSEGEPIVDESREKSISRPIVELWDEAYQELSKKDKSLVAGYEAQLSKSLTGAIGVPVAMFSGLGKIQRHEQMKVLLAKKIKEIEDGEWKLKFKDHELAVKGLVEAVVGVIDWAKDFVGTALEPSPYGSIAWAGVCVLLPLVLNPPKQEAARVKGLDDVATIISRCVMREALYRRRYESADRSESKREFASSHISYRDALRALYGKILNFQATSVCFLSKNTFSRVTADMVKWNDWDNMLADIKAQENILKSIEEQSRDMKYEEDCKLQNDQHEQRMRGLSAIEEEVSRVGSLITQAQNNNEREKLLEWLSSVDPSVNYNNSRKSHVLSTGDWLVEASTVFKKWEKAPNSLLWLHGRAGAGKSFLSSSIIHHLEKLYHSDPHVAVAYFYFSFSDTEKQNTENMLRSLIAQLCGGRPDTPKPLSDLHHYRNKHLQPGLEKLEETLQACTQDFKSVYLVVDALDECPRSNGEREKLLQLLGRIQRWTLPNLHVLYTSRPEPEIEAELRALFSGPATAIIDLQKRQKEMDGDIGTYIVQKLVSPAFRTWPSETKEDVKAALTGKADGMFQYVALQLEALQKAKSPAAVHEALKDLPEGLDETYNRMLFNIDPRQQAQAIRSLRWIAFSARPLKLSELAEASIIDPKLHPPFEADRRCFSPEDVLDFLSGLVTVIFSGDSKSSTSPVGQIDSTTNSELEWKRGTIMFTHFSVKEYLVSDRIQTSRCSIYSIKEKPANISIAEACLTYLLQFDKPDSLTSQTLRLPLVMYAACYWTEHAQWAGEDAIAIHLLTMEFFLSTRDAYVNWVRLFDPDKPWEKPQIAKDLTEVASPIYYASLTGLIEPVRQLLGKGTDVNAQGGYYGTALQAASVDGYSQIIQLLLENGADVNIRGGFHGTALQAASSRGHSQVVQQLLDNWADVNAQGGRYGNALQAASGQGRRQVVQQLLKHGADINAQFGPYNTALQAASSRGHGKVVQQLLENGADVNAQGGLCGTALQGASGGSYEQIVQLLLENGAIDRR